MWNCMIRVTTLEPVCGTGRQRWTASWLVVVLSMGLLAGGGLVRGQTPEPDQAQEQPQEQTQEQTQEQRHEKPQFLTPSPAPNAAPSLRTGAAPLKSESALMLEKIDHQKNAIKAQMEEVEAQFTQQMAQCSLRFGVTGCQLDAQAQHLERQRPLKKQLLPLQDLERAIKAQDSRNALAQQDSLESQEREKDRMLKAQAAYEERWAQHQKALLEHQSQSAKIPNPVAHPTSQAPTPQEQSQASLAHEHKLKEAREHQAQVQKRLSDKASHPKPLPTFEEMHTRETASDLPGIRTAPADSAPSGGTAR